MRRPTIQNLAVATIGILVVAVALWSYRVLASVMPYTIGVYAGIFEVLATLICLFVFCTMAHWEEIGTWRRACAAVTVGVSSSLLITFTAGVTLDEMFAPKYLWTVWNIERLGGHIQVEELRGKDVWVSLDGPQVTDAGLAYLEAFPRLRSLGLFNTKITDAGLQHLKGSSHLRFLHLSFNNVTDDGLLYLRGLTNLTELELSGTKVTDDGLEHLRGLTQLYLLRLGMTRVTDAGLERLKGLTRLDQLDLQQTQVTDEAQKHFSRHYRSAGLRGSRWLAVVAKLNQESSCAPPSRQIIPLGPAPTAGAIPTPPARRRGRYPASPIPCDGESPTSAPSGASAPRVRTHGAETGNFLR